MSSSKRYAWVSEPARCWEVIISLKPSKFLTTGGAGDTRQVEGTMKESTNRKHASVDTERSTEKVLIKKGNKLKKEREIPTALSGTMSVRRYWDR